MYKNKIPKASVYRLAVYLQILQKSNIKNGHYISSLEIGKLSGIDSAQVRKDLSYFGQFGEVGRGYHMKSLMTNLKKILKLHNKVWKVALAGLGNLGMALLSYKGFKDVGFQITAVFDVDKKKVGKVFSGITVHALDKISYIIKKENIKIGIIAVPADSAQEVALLMVDSGIKSIINFAPVRLSLPDAVVKRNVDLSNEFLSLPFYIV